MFARGKVILLGEHAVVHGRPALVAGLDRGVEAHATSNDRDVLCVVPWNREVAPTGDDPLSRAFQALLATLPAARPRIKVDANVMLPPGAGLGCSAAMGVAILGALHEALGIEREPRMLAEESLAWERVFHGQPSGIDSAAAAIGGVLAFRRGEPPESLTIRKPLSLVIADSDEPSSTKSMVDQVRRQLERTPARVETVFDGIAALVQSARIALDSGDHVHLGSLLNLCHALLSSLMVSTTRLEDLIGLAREQGALGAKVTGAGGGGCMVALMRSTEDAHALVDRYAATGVQAFATTVSPSP